MGYEQVWPSDQIGDDEMAQLSQRGELCVSYAVEIGDIIHACDALEGVDFEQDVSFEIVGATNGLAVLVKIRRDE